MVFLWFSYPPFKHLLGTPRYAIGNLQNSLAMVDLKPPSRRWMLCVGNVPQAALALVYLYLEGGSLVVTLLGAGKAGQWKNIHRLAPNSTSKIDGVLGKCE